MNSQDCDHNQTVGVDDLNVPALFYLSSEQDSERFAVSLAACLRPPITLTFSGEIGMGKTTIIRALLKAYGVASAIKSPTFSLVESYALKDVQVHHFDLYRIHDETELDYIGFRDYFDGLAICCIEWPERATHYTSCADLSFTLTKHQDGRYLTVNALTAVGCNLLACLRGRVTCTHS